MNRWGPLAKRYETKKPRRLLALDGGGIRGLLTLEILAEIESQLAQKTGRASDFRLGDYFDYIAGTSTGAIIAAGLAKGMSVKDLLAFFKKYGSKIFDKEFLLYRLKNLYKSDPLAKLLQDTFGSDTNLFPEHLKCLLLIVTHNVTTDSPWPISSNPFARYNDPDRSDCNLKIPLWQLVRASTAAPIYFPPEILECDSQNPDKTFVFVDGGMTPYNNPAFLLYRMATNPAYQLNWERGEDKLLLLSIGTGAAAKAGPEATSAHQNLLSNLAGIPGGLMYGAQVDQDINCRTVGRCVYGEPIDRELGDLIPRDEQGDPLPLSENLGSDFLYIRYNVELSRSGLEKFGITDIDPRDVQKLDAVKYIESLSRIGRAAAKTDVSLEHFGPFV